MGSSQNDMIVRKTIKEAWKDLSLGMFIETTGDGGETLSSGTKKGKIITLNSSEFVINIDGSSYNWVVRIISSGWIEYNLSIKLIESQYILIDKETGEWKESCSDEDHLRELFSKADYPVGIIKLVGVTPKIKIEEV
jgi:hypothetical protein